MDDRDRWTPVTLTRDEPVAEAIPDGRAPDKGDAIGYEERRVRRRQVVFQREAAVAFVVRGNSHDDPGAIFGENVRGRDDR